MASTILEQILENVRRGARIPEQVEDAALGATAEAIPEPPPAAAPTPPPRTRPTADPEALMRVVIDEVDLRLARLIERVLGHPALRPRPAPPPRAESPELVSPDRTEAIDIGRAARYSADALTPARPRDIAGSDAKTEEVDLLRIAEMQTGGSTAVRRSHSKEGARAAEESGGDGSRPGETRSSVVRKAHESASRAATEATAEIAARIAASPRGADDQDGRTPELGIVPLEWPAPEAGPAEEPHLDAGDTDALELSPGVVDPQAEVDAPVRGAPSARDRHVTEPFQFPHEMFLPAHLFAVPGPSAVPPCSEQDGALGESCLSDDTDEIAFDAPSDEINDALEGVLGDTEPEPPRKEVGGEPESFRAPPIVNVPPGSVAIRRLEEIVEEIASSCSSADDDDTTGRPDGDADRNRETLDDLEGEFELLT